MVICGMTENNWVPLNPEKQEEYSNRVSSLVDSLAEQGVLKAQQRQILIDNFGLSGEPRKTPDEIAEDLGVTTFRVKERRRNAIRRLRRRPEVQNLVGEYYGEEYIEQIRNLGGK
jgi:DNA-directed RNA polymerase sigma subunit (sigma70/sigma32)